MENVRIAAFGGFRSIPPKAGGAGADKFAVELYPRIVKKGYQVVAYCRIYPGDTFEKSEDYAGIKLRYFKTVKKAGFDSFFHSLKATFDVIVHNRADVIHHTRSGIDLCYQHGLDGAAPRGSAIGPQPRLHLGGADGAAHAALQGFDLQAQPARVVTESY